MQYLSSEIYDIMRLFTILWNKKGENSIYQKIVKHYMGQPGCPKNPFDDKNIGFYPPTKKGTFKYT